MQELCVCLTSVCYILPRGTRRAKKKKQSDEVPPNCSQQPPTPAAPPLRMDSLINPWFIFLFRMMYLHSAASSGHQGILYNYNKIWKQIINVYDEFGSQALRRLYCNLTGLCCSHSQRPPDLSEAHYSHFFGGVSFIFCSSAPSSACFLICSQQVLTVLHPCIDLNIVVERRLPHRATTPRGKKSLDAISPQCHFSFIGTRSPLLWGAM